MFCVVVQLNAFGFVAVWKWGVNNMKMLTGEEIDSDRGLNIMLVDSKPYFRKGMRDMLLSEFENRINEISEASNGKEFLEKIKEFPANIVFMETEQSEINGVDATSTASKLFPDLKIFALSAYDDSQYVTEILNAGAYGFLSKNENVLERIRSIINSFEIGYSSESAKNPEAILNGLMFECPMRVETNNCPILKIRQKQVIERFNHLRMLSSIEKTSLYNLHKACLTNRERNKIYQ